MVQSGMRCLRSCAASGDSCCFCLHHGGCPGIPACSKAMPAWMVGHWHTVSDRERQFAEVARTWERSRFRRIGPHSARKSALASAQLEVKSDGHWRPRENLSHHRETEEWELDIGLTCGAAVGSMSERACDVLNEDIPMYESRAMFLSIRRLA